MELVSPDPATAATFYSGLFEWETEQVDSTFTRFTLGGFATAGLVASPQPDQPAAWLVYIATEDLESTVEAVGTSGGTVVRAPTEIGDRGQVALCTDPEGAMFGVWRYGSFRGAQVVSEPGAMCWNDLAVRDMPAATTFYGKVFGWTEQRGEIQSAFEYYEWSVNRRVVAGMVPMTEQYPAEVPAHWRATLEVADCAATAARTAELGGTVVIGPLDVGVGSYAQIMDPLGGSVGVIELVPELQLTPPEMRAR